MNFDTEFFRTHGAAGGKLCRSRMNGQADAPTKQRQKPDPPRREAQENEAEDQDRCIDDSVDPRMPIEEQPLVADPGIALLHEVAARGARLLLAGSQRAAGLPRIGLANGWFYQAVSHPGAFFDVTTGNNDLAGAGCCQATVGYDLASGLGVPNWAILPATLPPPG